MIESRIVIGVNVPELSTSAQAALFLGLSESQVNRLAAAGVLATHVRAGGRRGPRFFHRDELARVAAERNLAS